MSSCFLAEWYRPGLDDEQLDGAAARLNECAVSMSSAGIPVQLLSIVAVPEDDFVFGLFAAGSAEAVEQTCLRAGVPAHRLTAATDRRYA